jgi:hypothetical protein
MAASSLHSSAPGDVCGCVEGNKERAGIGILPLPFRQPETRFRFSSSQIGHQRIPPARFRPDGTEASGSPCGTTGRPIGTAGLGGTLGHFATHSAGMLSVGTGAAPHDAALKFRFADHRRRRCQTGPDPEHQLRRRRPMAVWNPSKRRRYSMSSPDISSAGHGLAPAT